MSTEQAGAVVIQVTAGDFERLWENSTRWLDFYSQLGRLERLDSAGAGPMRQWTRIYWMGRDYTAVIFARAFLAARGHDYEVLYDAASGKEGGKPFGYVILTDYEGKQEHAHD